MGKSYSTLHNCQFSDALPQQNHPQPNNWRNRQCKGKHIHTPGIFHNCDTHGDYVWFTQEPTCNKDQKESQLIGLYFQLTSPPPSRLNIHPRTTYQKTYCLFQCYSDDKMHLMQIQKYERIRGSWKTRAKGPWAEFFTSNCLKLVRVRTNPPMIWSHGRLLALMTLSIH